jgi:uncharacterized membrane protein YoaK (UPF0700 family)
VTFLHGLTKDAKHGPLPLILLVLTLFTGVIDAVSILGLGRVFVANMTGNVVFTGFALAGAPGFSLAASLSALAGFLVGALVAGRALDRARSHRGVRLRNGVAAEFVLVAAALIVALVVGSPVRGWGVNLIAALAAVAMGIQNTVVRRLAVPDLTTTVLTMTLTGLAADLTGSARGPVLTRRLLAVVAMLLGAVVGALLVLRVNLPTALGAATGLLALVTLGVAVVSRPDVSWR